ncbi:MAG: hypothetical protein F6K47_02075 [Symploca sp. SIO2E6]|nr:hypothetical protein [Symploca sp. SIO2E6]
MNKNIAFDFDGVCTDLSFAKECRMDKSEFLYSPVSISISPIRKGIAELISVSGLFTNVFILTSRPKEARATIQEWLLQKQLLDLIEDIICCCGVPKVDFMKMYKIGLLVDDKTKNLPKSDEDMQGIFWTEQSWLEVLRDILNYFVASQSRLKGNYIRFLKGFEDSTDLGTSPVFIFNLDDQSKLKLRVCSNNLVRDKIITFLCVAKNNFYHNVADLVAVNGLAILKTFIEGVSISSLKGRKRLDSIFKAGVALARLHLIKFESVDLALKLNIFNDAEESLLVFSADNYNMIVTCENEVAFIDLEACNFGSRWIDYYWAQELLCQNSREKSMLDSGYFSVYKGCVPSVEHQKMAKISYKVWLSYQLQHSEITHASDSKKIKTVKDALQKLWNLE